MRWREMVQMLQISFTNMVHGFQQWRDQTPGPGCWSQSSDDVKIGFSDVEIDSIRQYYSGSAVLARQTAIDHAVTILMLHKQKYFI